MIGGNVTAVIETQTASKNSFGAVEKEWEYLKEIKGFLDYTGGDGSYKNNFKGDIEETTHIFICDYDWTVSKQMPTRCRMTIDEKIYNVLMIDNPMCLNNHLEIMLKYNGVVK